MEELAAWLHLALAPGIGPRTLLEAAGEAPDVPALVAAPPPALRAALAAVDPAAVEAALAWTRAPRHHLLHWLHPDYPPLLRELPDPPLVLWVIGDPDLLSLPQVAIVGSRHPTRDGLRNAHAFAAHLAAAGLIVTSGLAMGIDGAAHAGALESGRTLAVMGTGIDRIYPARHRDLAHRIVDTGGALVSEFPPGTPPRGRHFPRRNRIISGLALGTLVVEAALRSGSLITARLAAEQGREVFAIPGSIHNPLARGCHRLIREGAKLVETGQDIVEELGALLGGLAQPERATASAAETPTAGRSGTAELTDEQKQLLELIGYDPISIDELVVSSGLTPEALSSMLLILELEGCVVAHPGGRYARA